MDKIDLTRLYHSMPEDVQRKMSLYDLDRIVKNYNKDSVTLEQIPQEVEEALIVVSQFMKQNNYQILGGLELR